MLLSIERLHTVTRIVKLAERGGILVLIELRLFVDVVVVTLVCLVSIDAVDVVRDSFEHVHPWECNSSGHCV